MMSVVDAAGQAAVSRFAGSVEKGVYEVDYGTIAYATAAAAQPEVRRMLDHSFTVVASFSS
jgi:hypothetical protein